MTVNPAWEKLLSQIPQELHAGIVPILTDWDNKFAEEQQKVQAFEQFKPIVDAGIDFNRVDEALKFAFELQKDPKTVVAKLNEAWKLGFVPEDSIPPPANTPDPLEEWDGVDLTKHPMFNQLQQQLQSIQESFENQQRETQEEKELREFEASVDAILNQDDNKNVPRELVMAYMAQGFEGSEAVNRVKSFLGTGVTVPDPTVPPKPPVVLGGEGAAGSGLPSGAIDVGHKVGNGAIEDIVMQMLQQDASSNNQG